ncbi:hypothetical protein BDW72DRAFT_28312 [Aspergillus terricola var. indicus]
MLRKKEAYTTITPIPPSVPRQLAIDILHSHSEIITLSPLVLSHHPVKAPRNAPAEEYYLTWYEITERVQYVPGMGRLGSGKISFKGCFHDEAWGLVTHVYAPLGIDLRHRYRIVDSTDESVLDSGAKESPPTPGEAGKSLYLSVDTDMECNITLMPLVKGQQRAALKALIDRFVKKAELLDAGFLQAGTTEDGKLRTWNPADRSSSTATAMMQPASPTALYSGPGEMSPRSSSYQAPTSPTGQSHRGSVSSQGTNLQYGRENRHSFPVELPADTPNEPSYRPYRPGAETGKSTELPDSSSRFQPGSPAELPAGKFGVR